MSKDIYITTTLPYVNAEPHIGFALEIIHADALARFYRKQGFSVFFNFGTDEHGQKIYQKAIDRNQDPQEYCDEYAQKFNELKIALNLSYDNFIRTTDLNHVSAAQAFWEKCLANGDIYKRLYPTKYCVGCELEKQESELEKGRCPYHPNLEIQIIEEENYFFRWSKYESRLLELYKKNPDFVIPSTKLHEITVFVESGLNDFSISRLKSKMPWGIPVPNDPDHVMYVWFDALVNYISAIGWPNNQKKFTRWWPVIQLAGKDNLRQQAAMWQAMLMSAGISPSKQIVIHGFLTIDGQKISKSLGNVINPIEEVEKYGTDPLRYYLLAKVSPFEDSDFSQSKFISIYNGELANGLGNLVARLAKLSSQVTHRQHKAPTKFSKELIQNIEIYKFNEAISFVWTEQISSLDKYINDSEPWKQEHDKKCEIVNTCIPKLLQVAFDLQPFLPETAKSILNQFTSPKIIPMEPLFPRIK